MREAARDEYLRLLPIARDLAPLRVVRVERKPFAPFYDVRYRAKGTDPRTAKPCMTEMSVKTFIKKKDADRFVQIAMSEKPIPERKNPNVRP